VGKWEARKGFDVLLPAFAAAFAADDDVELLIVSHSFHDTSSWKQRVEHALGNRTLLHRLRIVSMLSFEDLPKLYKVRRRAALSFSPSPSLLLSRSPSLFYCLFSSLP
jgi:hypothetical protein